MFDGWGRCARVQPLGTRTRITLSENDLMVAEGEVDIGYLTDRVNSTEAPYEAIAAVLNEENGPARDRAERAHPRTPPATSADRFPR